LEGEFAIIGWAGKVKIRGFFAFGKGGFELFGRFLFGAGDGEVNFFVDVIF